MGWAQEDVAEDDMQSPTKVKYGKVSGLIQPVFDILEFFRDTESRYLPLVLPVLSHCSLQ